MTVLGTERQFNFEWRDEQRPGKYPFSDACSLQTADGLDLGADTFLDAHLFPIGGDARLRITSITVDSDLVTIQIGDESDEQRMSGSFAPLNPPETLSLVDRYGRPAGVLVADELSLSRFQSWSKDTHTFGRSAAEFVASVCCPMPELGVRGILTPDGDVLTGEVWIVGENGLIVREDPDQTIPDGWVLRVDLVGDPLFRRKLCEATASSPGGDVSLFQTPRILRTINHKPPDQYGNFTLTVGRNVSLAPILRVQPSSRDINIFLVGQLTQSPN